ncbi:hypothetical protein Nepgr_006378 [Nepenthes gracilis]|uniref:Phytocyanin domain-containing protein n=1 Tax=Nepenthes gracilis TaxID=150966 RepID=A0AAD3S504_NEPGR|nr:hypothetical protein Nepgr_006378 [Nepenthes gracilis]
MAAGKYKMGAAMMMVAAFLALFHTSAAQTTHTVGGTTGWTVPSSSSFYSSWASSQTFKVGDFLEFDFSTGVHTVAKVTQAAYDACNTGTTISVTTTGPANVTIDSAGTHYYICTVGQHCSLGQKLAVTATTTTSASPAPQPAAATPPSSSAPTPTSRAAAPTPTASAKTPKAAPTPSSPSGTATPPSTSSTTPTVSSTPTSSPTTPSSSAPPAAVAGLFFSFLSVALAFLY